MTFCVLTAFISHETATFSKRFTTLNDFQNGTLLYGEDIARKTVSKNIEPAGFLEAAERFGWDLIHTIAASATPSGPVQRDAWAVLSGKVLDNAQNHRAQIDGVLLSLHGAMAIEDDFDAEGLLLAQLRDILGLDKPIVVTLDLHANVTDRMVANCDALFAYRTYPHVDQISTVLRAATTLDRTLRHEIRPKTIVARRSMVKGLDHGRTTVENPMTELLAQAETLEQQDDNLITISLCAGFRLTDVEQAGPSVTITSDGEGLTYAAMAEHFMDYAWEQRHFDSNSYLSVDACIACLEEILAIPGATNAGPIVIADYSDNPGSGAYGDSTFLLKGLLDAKVNKAAFGTIFDPAAAAQLAAAGIGAETSLFIGGKTDPKFGPPIFVSGRVKQITTGQYTAQGPYARGKEQNLGTTVVFHVAGVDVLISSKCIQITELETFSHANIAPGACDIIVVKSKQHFRAAFEPIASQVLIVDSGAMATEDITRLPYKNLRRPIYPLDLE